jgi:transmembrane 9 superfamily protein 3
MWILLLLPFGLADERTHKYSEGEDVVLWFNKLVPFNNPQESYAYSNLPLCRGSKDFKKYSMGIGEIIEGYELEDSGIEIKFERPGSGQYFCEIEVNREVRDALFEAVSRKFWLQMYLDDLPMWSALGDYDEATNQAYLFTHYTFAISYKKNRIISAKANFERPVSLSKSSSIQFSYSVVWHQSDTPFGQRFNSYLDPGFFENNVHWFSIMNSFVMVLLLCLLVLLIVYRTVSKDVDRYNIQEVENEFVETKGWKQVAGDAFRPPPLLPIFTSLVSTGWHLAIMTLLGIFTSILHPMYMERGSLTYYLLLEYALLGTVGGFHCGSIYTEYKGKRWPSTALLSAFGFPAIVMLTGTILNLTALLYSSSASIPVFTIFELLALFSFIYLPLFALGLVIGRKYQMTQSSPVRLNSVQSPILREKKYYNKPSVLMLLGGILPFSSIYVEIYYIFTSFWNYKFYYVYGFTLMTFVLLAISIACVAIVVTYATLNSEDYRWHWVSFLASASVGAYLFVYSVYYYFVKTQMTGIFQFSFYFGYISIISLYLALVSGALGYSASGLFVGRIYSNIKRE